jgi:hypothetical protein
MVLVGAGLYYLFGRMLPSLTVGLVALAVLMVWMCFLMPTRCDYRTRRDTMCPQWVRGKLRGCRTHRRLKRDAVIDAVKLRNPELLSWVSWTAPGNTISGSSLPTNGRDTEVLRSAAPSRQAAYGVVLLLCAMFSTLSAAVALLI